MSMVGLCSSPWVRAYLYGGRDTWAAPGYLSQVRLSQSWQIQKLSWLSWSWLPPPSGILLFIYLMYVNNRTAFSQNLLSDLIIHWRNWKQGDSYKDHTMLRHNRKPQCMLTMTWHWVDLGESVYMELLRSSWVVGSWVVTGKVTQSRKRSDPTTWVTLYYPRQFYHGSCKPSLGLPIKAVCIQILTLPKCPGVTGDSGARVSLPPYDRPLDVWIYGFLFI